jgi:aspartate/glutamate racemase
VHRRTTPTEAKERKEEDQIEEKQNATYTMNGRTTRKVFLILAIALGILATVSQAITYPTLEAPAEIPNCGSQACQDGDEKCGCEDCTINCSPMLAHNGMCCQLKSNTSCTAAGRFVSSIADCQAQEDHELCRLNGTLASACAKELKPRQPQRVPNPMCIGVIGGAGPQAGADVMNKVMNVVTGLPASDQANTMNKTIERRPWYRQARDMPMVSLISSSQLDATTQNNWGWANEAEQKSNIGRVLVEIEETFPECVVDRGALGLACNTIHTYLWEGMNDTIKFVSIVKAVKDTIAAELEQTGSKDVFVLGSAVTMTEEGEYKALFKPFTDWNVNEGLETEKDRGWLWENVILKVQQGQSVLAHNNFVEFLEKFIPADYDGPISLSCTELPIAAISPDTGKFVEGYNFIDPNLELAKALVTRAEEIVQEKTPEQWDGYTCGVDTFIELCCDKDDNTTCTSCCEDKACATAPDTRRVECAT